MGVKRSVIAIPPTSFPSSPSFPDFKSFLRLMAL